LFPDDLAREAINPDPTKLLKLPTEAHEMLQCLMGEGASHEKLPWPAFHSLPIMLDLDRGQIDSLRDNEEIAP